MIELTFDGNRGWKVIKKIRKFCVSISLIHCFRLFKIRVASLSLLASCPLPESGGNNVETGMVVKT